MTNPLWAAAATMLVYSHSTIAFTATGRRSLALGLRATRLLLSSNTDNAEPTTVTKDGTLIVNSMPPPLPDPLHNEYYLLRHGQSEGNVEGVISSARSLATSEKHSLTPLGYEQGRESARKLLECIEREGDGGTADAKRRSILLQLTICQGSADGTILHGCLDG